LTQEQLTHPAAPKRPKPLAGYMERERSTSK